MDLLLGRFADAQLAELTDAELEEYERLLTLPDPQLYAWMSGNETAPADVDTPLYRRIRDFHLNAKPE